MRTGVEWSTRLWGSQTEAVVTLWRPGGLPVAVDEAQRAGRLRQGTIRATASVVEAMVALELSGRDVTADDLPEVADAVLAGFDLEGSDEVERAAMATRAVLAGSQKELDRAWFRSVWPDPARLVHCRAVVTALLTAGMSHIDQKAAA
jgi:hypothetical protein